MIHPRLSYSLLCTASLLLAPQILYAQSSSKADCAALAKKNCRQNTSMDPKDVQQCILRGYDAPITCRQDEGRSSGVRVQGSGGFSYGTIAAPANSPGAMGAPPSAGVKSIQNSFGMPPWTGKPCVLPGGINLCDLGVHPSNPVDPNDPCPVKSDTAGLFGIKFSLNGGNVGLSCGGAMPLTSYELTLNKNPARLASTEYGSYYIWLYQNQGARFALDSGSPAKLTTVLCKEKTDPLTLAPMIDPTSGKRVYEWAVDVPPPIAQMVTYNNSTESMTLRLQQREKLRDANGVDTSEKFLVIPLVGGVPKLPKIPKLLTGHGDNPETYTYTDCSLAKDYYKDVTNSRADIVIESAVNPGCEGPPSQCNGVAEAPSPNTNCDVINLYPKGTFGGTVCDGKVQYGVLDRPNLVYPPNTTVSTLPMEGRTAVLAATTDGSKIYMQPDTGLRLGKTAPPVTLPEGGTIFLADNSKLLLFGPATIDLPTNTVTLSAGGQHQTAGGTLIEQLPNGATFNPTAALLPLRLSVRRSMGVPPGFLVPTQPTPYVQAPLEK